MKISLTAGAVALAIATPASAAIVFNTTGTTDVAASQSFVSAGVTATFTGSSYAGTVAAMNAANGNVALNPGGTVRRASTGLGVAGDGQADQVDSTGVNELLQVTFSVPGQKYAIQSVTLGKIDNNDTFALFGGNNGVFTRLGFLGAIQSGITGGIPVTVTGSGENYTLTFNHGVGYDSFRFGTNLEESDGFSLRGLAVVAVPEPSTWAMLILGFGMVGAALRRRTQAKIRTLGMLSFA